MPIAGFAGRFVRALGDAVKPVAAAPGKTAVGAIGAAVATAALILASVFGAESQARVSDEFARLDATRIAVTSSSASPVRTVFSDSVLRRVQRFPGVRHAGLSVSLGTETVWSPGGPRVDAPLYAISDDTLAAAGADLPPGLVGGRRRQVAYIGAGLAKKIQLPPLGAVPAVRRSSGGAPLAIAGTLKRAPGVPQMLSGLTVNLCCGRDALPARTAELLVATHAGVTSEIADRLPELIDPEHPETIVVAVDATPTNLRGGVERSVTSAARIATGGALLLGLLINGLLRYAAVRERRAEFGLRTALGATRTDITVQVVSECALVGLIGSAIGTSLAVCAGFIVANQTGHDLGISVGDCLAALVLGVIVGALAGVVPARAAAAVSPAVALRST